MVHFHYSYSELHCESLPIASIAKAVETPFYLYSRQTYRENFNDINKAFSQRDHLICYALKANSNPNILHDLAQMGAGADVVSIGELYLAQKAGISADRIVFAGVGKRDDEIKAALTAGIRGFNVESESELQVIDQLANKCGTIAPISLRVNPNIDIHGHPYISTGRHADKFGIELDSVIELLQSIRKLRSVKLVGLHSHIGSQIVETAPFEKVGEFMARLAKQAADEGHELDYLDLGGGLGVNYKNAIPLAPDTAPTNGLAIDPQLIAQKLLTPLDFFSGTVIFEPGRALVANCGVLVTRVLHIKESQGKRFVIVDGGMSDLIRPSLYNAYHQIAPVKFQASALQKCDVVGPICESGDFLGKDCELPSVQRGDLLTVFTTGAYGFTLASNYNARPRPAEVIIDHDQIILTRPRQKLEEIWKG